MGHTPRSSMGEYLRQTIGKQQRIRRTEWSNSFAGSIHSGRSSTDWDRTRKPRSWQSCRRRIGTDTAMSLRSGCIRTGIAGRRWNWSTPRSSGSKTGTESARSRWQRRSMIVHIRFGRPNTSRSSCSMSSIRCRKSRCRAECSRSWGSLRS